jgi:ferredoxin, 2Fe-2S
MPEIIIRSLENKVLKVEQPPKTLLWHIQQAYLDWMHTCGAKGRCTTCRVIVLDGSENFSQLTAAELKYAEKSLLKVNERLACQANVLGNVVVAVPIDCRLPHVDYSDE